MWWCEREVIARPAAARRPPPRRCPRWGAAALAAVLLAGCGFHLRGSDPSERLAVTGLYAEEGSVSGLLASALRRGLVAAGAQMAKDRAAARVIVQLLGESQTKSVLAVGNTGRVEDYELRYTLNFQVVDAQGKVLLKPQQVALLRALTFNPTDVLAKGNEVNNVFRGMRTDAVSQVIRRLVSAFPQ